ncbi:MAG: YqzE family protein [Bacillus sp. (in: firmicutes)]
MKTNDFVKYLTQQFVTYVDQPKEERKRQRNEDRKRTSNYSTALFGWIPFALMMVLKRKKK